MSATGPTKQKNNRLLLQKPTFSICHVKGISTNGVFELRKQVLMQNSADILNEPLYEELRPSSA
jgi:hypothetical protein